MTKKIKRRWWEIMARMPIIPAPDLTADQIKSMKAELALDRRIQKKRERHEILVARGEAEPL